MIYTNPSPLPAKRILVIRYRFIGDTILTVPFLRNLRENYPEARIDMLVGPQSGKVLEGCPYVDEFIVYDTTRFHKYDSAAGKPKSFFNYALMLRQKKYDLVFVLKRSLSASMLAWLTGARYRVGYGMPGRKFLLSHAVEWKQNIHEVESTLSVLQAAGATIKDTHLESFTTPEQQRQLEQKHPQLLEYKNRPKVLFHAAAAHPDKMYPLDSWATVIKDLATTYNIIPVFTGAAQDSALYQELERLAETPSLNLSGQLSLSESLALMSLMDLSICVDSGPAHLAASAGVPCLVLFGPTDPVRWHPWGPQHLALFDENLACRPCHYKKTCLNRECLTEYSPQKIIEAAALKLASLAAKRPAKEAGADSQ